jgi:hypothetical protein
LANKDAAKTKRVQLIKEGSDEMVLAGVFLEKKNLH